MSKKRLNDLELRTNSVLSWAARIGDSGITQSELARRSGISRTTLWFILKGNRIPNSVTINSVNRVLKELGV